MVAFESEKRPDRDISEGQPSVFPYIPTGPWAKTGDPALGFSEIRPLSACFLG
jgi:hypothetical protein